MKLEGVFIEKKLDQLLLGKSMFGIKWRIFTKIKEIKTLIPIDSR